MGNCVAFLIVIRGTGLERIAVELKVFNMLGYISGILSAVECTDSSHRHLSFHRDQVISFLG